MARARKQIHRLLKKKINRLDFLRVGQRGLDSHKLEGGKGTYHLLKKFLGGVAT